MGAGRYVRRLLALSATERLLLLRAYLGLAQIGLRLRLFGFQRVLRSIEQAARPAVNPLDREALPRASQYAHWVECAARHHVFRARCLQQSLLLHAWLRREGLPSELQIGVLKQGDAVQAHAWVELAGVVLGDHPASVASFKKLTHPARPHD